MKNTTVNINTSKKRSTFHVPRFMFPKRRFTFYVLRSTFITLAIITIVAVPLFVSADAIVVCGTISSADGVVQNPCTFNDFIKTINGIVKGTIIVISAYAAVSFMYAGYAYLTSGGNQEKVSHAKSIFWKVFLGYIIILGAWAFVYMIEKTLFSEDPNARPNSFLNGGTPTPTPTPTHTPNR